MAVLSIEEFKAQSSTGENSWEKIYQGKILVAGPIFSLQNLKAAILYCRRFTRKTDGAICIIVRDKSFLRIWNENLQNNQKKGKSPKKVSSKSSRVKNKKKVPANSSPVEADFIDFCQKLLTEYIGPVAPILCKKTLAKNPNLTPEEFVKILVKKISNSQQAKEFQQAAFNYIR